MRRLAAAAASLTILMLLGQQAQAGVYTDDLGKCLVKSTSDADQKALVFWVFKAMSHHPDVQAYANIPLARGTEADKAVAGIFERLIAVDCRQEAVQALKYEGESAIEPAFAILGQVAMRGLTSDPSVMKGMEGLAAHLHPEKLAEVFKEAGIGASPATSK